MYSDANFACRAIATRAREIINQCAAGIAVCWELSKGDDEHDLSPAFNGVSTYLPVLKAVVRDSAPYRKDAASLAGQCALLQCLLVGIFRGGKRKPGFYVARQHGYEKEQCISLEVPCVETVNAILTMPRS